MRRVALATIGLLTATLVVTGLQDRRESIRGTVMRADTLTPFPGARLELVREDHARLTAGHEKPCRPERDAESNRPTYAFTDVLGRFAFNEIAPGNYYLFAEHEGFQKAAYGQRGRFPIPVALKIGTDDANYSTAPGVPPIKNGYQEIKLSLTPSHAISGVVLGDDGALLTAASVQLYQFRYTPLNGRALKSVRVTLTDDLGKYRLAWLNPGRYIVAGGYGEYGLRAWIQGLKFTPNLPSPDSGLPVSFFSRADTVADAQPVRVDELGAQIADIRVRMRPRTNIRVQMKGLALDMPVPTLLFLPSGSDICASFDYGVGQLKNEEFEVRDVPEGIYAAAAMRGNEFMSDVITVSVEAANRNEVVIPVTKPLAIPGNVTYSSLPPNADLSGVRFNLIRKGQELQQAFTAGVDPANKHPFLLRGVGPGAYLPTMDLPPGFFLESVNLSNPDKSDPEQPCIGGRPYGLYMDQHGHLDIPRPLLVPSHVPGAGSCLSVVVGYGSAIYGFVIDKTGKPVAGAFVVALPSGAWTKNVDAGVVPPDRILVTSSDLNGHFVLRGTTGGISSTNSRPQEYRLLAFESLDPSEIYDPNFVDRFRGHEYVEIRIEGATQQTRGVRAGQSTPTVRLNDCNEESDIGAKHCYVTVIPASETVETQ